ncbi:MAG: penicillin-binding protein 2 [Ruminococcaceae bacterium]|nr:penicillin-binding protein 2 [Oscillospiraceae bacterium]
MFSKRALSVFLSLSVLFAICIARVFTVASNEKLSTAAVKQSTRVKTVSALRGTVYDVNGVPLTNIANRTVTVIFPSEKGAVAAGQLLKGDELENALKTLRSGTPVIVDKAPEFEMSGAVTVSVPKRYSGVLSHIIGYTDNSGHGVTGIEKGFDSLLYSEKGVEFSYTTDSNGRMIEGMGWSIDRGKNLGSVTLTIDSRLQSLAERALKNVGRGAVVIMDAKTSEIRALVSTPSFSYDDLEGSLTASDSPFINRALCSYNVGSVFKPIVAAAAIENGMGDYKYTCEGVITVDGKDFRCNSSIGHGEVDLETALAKSCNTYFYTLAMKLGADAVYDVVSGFKFDSSLDLGGEITAGSGKLPLKTALANSRAALINLSIGQGDLMVTPVAMSLLYSSIVNGGEYCLPKIVKSYRFGSEETVVSASPPTVAMSRSTADLLKSYLKTALMSGTGSGAYIAGVDAGGKTGTAQTGWKDGDRHILNGWFCGFFEGEEDYVITVVREDVSSGSNDCAPIFKTITEEMKILHF